MQWSAPIRSKTGLTQSQEETVQSENNNTDIQACLIAGVSDIGTRAPELTQWMTCATFGVALHIYRT